MIEGHLLHGYTAVGVGRPLVHTSESACCREQVCVYEGGWGWGAAHTQQLAIVHLCPQQQLRKHSMHA